MKPSVTPYDVTARQIKRLSAVTSYNLAVISDHDPTMQPPDPIDAECHINKSSPVPQNPQ